MSPKYVDKDQKKKELALTSLPFFARGYKEASMKDIARGAGIGKGTIYEYFKNKADLFSFAISLWIENGAQDIKDAIIDIDNPIKRLYALIEVTMLEYGPDNQEASGVFMAIFQQTFYQTGVFHDKKSFIYSLSDSMINIISEIILEAVDKSFFKSGAKKEVRVISRNILAFMDGISIHRMIAGDSFDIKEHTEYFLKTLIQSLSHPCPDTNEYINYKTS